MRLPCQGQLLHTLTGHTESVYGVVFSPNGDTIATASGDKTVKLWNRQGQLLHTFIAEDIIAGDMESTSMVFSPDGKTIAFAKSDRTVELWNIKEKKLSITLTGHTEGVNSVVFSPNGDTIATASNDGRIRVWSRQGQLLRTLIAEYEYMGPRTSMVFSPDGKILATASVYIELWNLNDKERPTLQSKSFNFKLKDAPGKSTIVANRLSQQLIDQIIIIDRDALVSFDDLNVKLGKNVFPYVQRPAKEALKRAIADRGIPMVVTSSYRTIAEQMLRYNWGSSNPNSVVAVPGRSSHQSGVAIDIEDPIGWKPYLMAHGWVPLRGDPIHFDYQGDGTRDIRSTAILAFQKLWNQNNPYN